MNNLFSMCGKVGFRPSIFRNNWNIWNRSILRTDSLKLTPILVLCDNVLSSKCDTFKEAFKLFPNVEDSTEGASLVNKILIILNVLSLIPFVILYSPLPVKLSINSCLFFSSIVRLHSRLFQILWVGEQVQMINLNDKLLKMLIF